MVVKAQAVFGSSMIAGIPLAAGLGAATASPAQATLTFTIKTAADGTNVYAASNQVFSPTSGGLPISTDDGSLRPLDIPNG